jgi:NADH-quinone oxidoreductase subunit N
VTVFAGTFYALTQRRLKRMLIYSSIAQNGFIILCFGLQTVESISNLYFFLVIYLLSSFVIWTLVALLLSSSTKTSDFFELPPYPLYIDSMTSMAKRNAFFSFIATVVFFSLAGIPPVVGFLAKMNVVFELVNNDYLYASLLLLILSAVSVYYYIRTIKISFFEPSQSSDDHFFGAYSSDFDQPTYFSLSLILLLLIATFLFPTYLLMFSHLIALL